MKTPTWIIVMGICLLFFGGCGAYKNFNNINLSKTWKKGMVQLQKENLAQEEANIQFHTENSIYNMDSILKISDFSLLWMRRFGFAGIFVCLIYMVAGGLFFMRKRISLILAYGALCLSIVFSVTQLLTLGSDDNNGIIMNVISAWAIIGIAIDIALLLVLIFIKKDNFLLDPNHRVTTKIDSSKMFP